MYLTPTEEDRLRVFAAAQLARELLARGLKLNAPEATALLCDEMHVAARAGASYGEVLDAGRSALALEQLMDGVAELVREIRLEVLMDEGTRLVVLRDPWGAAVGTRPGEIRPAQGDVELSGGRARRHLVVTNRSTHPVRVSSHYPFWRANPRLEFDRAAAEGFRLDLPAGSSIRWAPGETREVDLVAYPEGRGAP